MDFSKYDFESLEPFTDSSFKKCYLDAVKMLEFAEKNNLKASFEMDDYDMPAQAFFDMVDMRLSNTNLNLKKPDMKDLTPALALMGMIIRILPSDLNFGTYVNQKTSLLFKMRKYQEAEDFMKKYLEENPLATYSYVELAIDFDGIAHDATKAIEYLKMGLSHPDIPDRDVLLDYLSDFEE